MIQNEEQNTKQAEDLWNIYSINMNKIIKVCLCNIYLRFVNSSYYLLVDNIFYYIYFQTLPLQMKQEYMIKIAALKERRS